MALNFQPTLGFVRHGNFIDNIEAKGIFCKTLDVDGEAFIDGNVTVTGTITGTVVPTNPFVVQDLVVLGNATLGDLASDFTIVNSTLIVNSNSTTFSTGGAAVNHDVFLDRSNDGFANALRFTTSGIEDWTIRIPDVSHQLVISQGPLATNQDMLIQLGLGTLQVTGAVSTPNATGGFISGGMLTNSAAATTLALTGKVGTATFTGVTIGAAAAQDFTITNTRAGSAGLVSLANATGGLWGDGSDPKIENIIWNAGVNIIVRVRNYSAATTTGPSTFTVMFHSFN